MQIINKSMNPITVRDQTLEEVNKIHIPGRCHLIDSGTEEAGKARIGNARTAFNVLKRDLYKQTHLTQYQVQDLQLQC